MKRWAGRRGEWYVATQAALMSLIFFGPRSHPSLPSWPLPDSAVWKVLGAVLMVCGGSLVVTSTFYLRRSLTPLPCPTPEGTLVQSGPYAIVRHPIYTGGLVLALGWALLMRGWLTLLYVVALAAFMVVKCRREERWLNERYPEYESYAARVRRLVPFLY